MSKKRPKAAHCMKCGVRITAEQVTASRAQYGDKAELCTGCLKNLSAAARLGTAPRSFNQAAFQYACEWSGTRDGVSIDGQRFVGAVSVAIREVPLADQVQGDVRYYELTLFAAEGDWRQLVFNVRGDLVTESRGAKGTAPSVSRAREVF